MTHMINNLHKMTNLLHENTNFLQEKPNFLQEKPSLLEEGPRFHEISEDNSAYELLKLQIYIMAMN